MHVVEFGAWICQVGHLEEEKLNMRKQLLEQAMNRGQRSVEACVCKLFSFFSMCVCVCVCDGLCVSDCLCDCVCVGMLNMVRHLSTHLRHGERQRKREEEKEEYHR